MKLPDAQTDMKARASRPLSSVPRPFIRWAGGKRWLLPYLVELLPETFGTYYEPFLGSGALYFLLGASPAVLGDVCAPLIGTYEGVRDDVEGVIGLLGTWQVDRPTFDRIKAVRPTTTTEAAARFIYLNHTCWNGLYRVNARGEFNVPYGRPKSTRVADPENLRECARLLGQATTVVAGDYTDVVERAGRGDLVYFDPPYVTGHNNNGFVDYNEVLFKWKDQERLAEVAADLSRHGAHVVVSNADHQPIIDLYPTFRVARVDRHSTIAGASEARRATSEVVLYNTPDH